MVFAGRISKGQPRVIDRVKYSDFVAGFDEGARVLISIVEEEEKRRPRANNYYRGVVLPTMARASGWFTADEIHKIMAARFLTVQDADGNDYVRSTAGLSIREMYEYTNEVIAFAAEMGIQIPEPNEVPR